MDAQTPMVSTAWLFERLGQTGIRIVDGSWHLPQMHRDPAREFEAQHIPSAVYFDIDNVAEPRTDLPHMVASPARFSDMVGELGIAETDTIIVYDSVGLMSAARVWWNFRIMGATKCFVLDGGLPKWLSEGRPVEAGPAVTAPARFVAFPNASAIVPADKVQKALADKTSQIVDVRPAGRFTGEMPEPRPGLRGGHMPGSVNLPFASLIVDGSLADSDALRAAFLQAGVALDSPIISTCGSGVTAPLLNLALAQIGIESMQVYDGSWAEWGSRDDLPVVRSA